MNAQSGGVHVTFVGLDVSLAKTNICVLDGEGARLFDGQVPSDPAALAQSITQVAPNCARIALETGPTTPWLWRGLKDRGLPVVCIDARHANKALSMRRNKTDKNDAHGLAELMRIGWYKEAQVRTVDAQYVRSMLSARYQLRFSRRNIVNLMRGIVKTFGLYTTSTATRSFINTVREIVRNNPGFAPLLDPLLASADGLTEQIERYESELQKIARQDQNAQRLMDVPGVGYLVCLAFMSTIDNPCRFKKSVDVGPYLGLAPRTRQSGETEWSAGIGPPHDKMVRSYLYEAATVFLTRSGKWTRLKAWGMRLCKRLGFKRAAIAVARKLAIIMHAIWVDGTEFEYGSRKERHLA